MYAELHALTNFSFLRAASSPAEMVARAAELGYSALAVTDECSVAGVVRAHEEAEKCGLHLIIGSELCCSDGLQIVVLATTRRGYGQLSQLITRARRAAPKGEYLISRNQLAGALEDCLLLWLPGCHPHDAEGIWLREHFPERVWIGVELHHGGDDRGRLQQLQQLGARLGLPLTACSGALMHVAERKPLQDVMTAIRLGRPLTDCGYALQSNSARHLRTREDLAACYPAQLLHTSTLLAERCTFSLKELRYEYPRELVPEGETPASWLRKLTYAGAAARWPQGVPAKVEHLLEHELTLIAELRYDPFFLTVHDLVRKAEELEILCQGRGSAANSAVCYCLGVTAVDPSQQEVLFERFISRERNEPPDIDLDFEHERREEIIQYIYDKYGRHRAGIAATVITYRLRSALRDVGKALGLDVLQIERLITTLSRRAGLDNEQLPQWLREAGFDPDSRIVRHLIERVVELVGFPRHLSQHVGGFVIAAELLEDLVPVENATMEGRTVIQWDKDDLEALGLLKVDVLALGMLTALRRALLFHNQCTGQNLTLRSIPVDDAATYKMIQRADTIGVFQIESRAQMSMLPRLKPKSFYDLVIEVAIVRPGPIQGDMVHPYLRRRDGLEAVDYPSEAVRHVLKRTLGVPIFQEQVMQLAVVAAGFTPGEADRLRRAMAAWKRHGDLEPFRIKLMNGLLERGYKREFADRLFRQIQGFSEYGFPESHAASFALLAYASSWLKCHSPAAFTAALINSQPMGFYVPAQLVRDAREHGVEVRPVDVLVSDWDCTLEAEVRHAPVLRLGLRLVKGLSRAGAERLMAARSVRSFTDAQDLAHRAQLGAKDLAALGAANALLRLSGNRHQAAWTLAGVDIELPLLAEAAGREGTPLLRVPTEGQNITSDYQSVGLTLGRHPLALLRERCVNRELKTAAQLRNTANAARVGTIGLVLLRQSPGTAKNTTFITLEDETGQLNLIVWADTAQKYRRPFLEAQLLEIHGTLQHHSDVMHVVVDQMVDRSAWLGALRVNSRDFR